MSNVSTDIATLRNRPEGIRLIAASVRKLVKPSFAHLPQVLLDQRAAVREQDIALQRRQQTIAQEGFEAAIRLLLGNSDRLQFERVPYFEQLDHYRRDHHES